MDMFRASSRIIYRQTCNRKYAKMCFRSQIAKAGVQLSSVIRQLHTATRAAIIGGSADQNKRYAKKAWQIKEAKCLSANCDPLMRVDDHETRTNSLDLGHFGMAEVSCGRHLGTVLKSNTKHTVYPKAYLSVLENNLKFNPSGLYRAALSHGSELQSLVPTMSGCSAQCIPCSTGSVCLSTHYKMRQLSYGI